MMSTISDCIRDFKIEGCPKNRLAAIKTYLALSMGRYADYGSSMTFWDARGPSIQKTFGLPTLQMRWSYPETNPFADFSGSYQKLLDGVVESIRKLPSGLGQVKQADAVANGCIPDSVVSTDPPYDTASPFLNSDFSSPGDRAVVSGDTLSVTYTLSLAG